MASESEQTEEDIRETLRSIDTDGDGYIGAKDLHYIMETYGELLTDEEVNNMIGERDIDEDSLIACEELIDPIKNLLEKKKKEQENKSTTSKD
ncbi:calmodulin-like [Rana temporaria]|uniref:calmodulin-like n=1 Tax=Rana temporaria TaxID=8407 RepID=UPI001AAD2585|nr:calmodulin-like [Rana temporaria]